MEQNDIILIDGEKEIWKVCKNYEEYEVSNYGRVRNKANKHIMKPSTYCSNSYPMVHLRKGIEGPNGKYVKCHRLVGENFLPEDPNPEHIYIDHIDHNRSNCFYKNLRWVSAKENRRNALPSSPRIYKDKTPIVLVELGTQKLIQEFSCPNEAGEKLSLSPSYIITNIHGRTKYSFGKFLTKKQYEEIKNN